MVCLITRHDRASWLLGGEECLRDQPWCARPGDVQVFSSSLPRPNFCGCDRCLNLPFLHQTVNLRLICWRSIKPEEEGEERQVDISSDRE